MTREGGTAKRNLVHASADPCEAPCSFDSLLHWRVYRVALILALASFRVPLIPALAGVHVTLPLALARRRFRLAGQSFAFSRGWWVTENDFPVSTCPCEVEVPFGRAMIRFLVKVEGCGNVCCFRFMRVAKRNGGALVGADS